MLQPVPPAHSPHMKALRMPVTRIQSDHSESNQTTRSPIRPLRIQSDHSESNQTTQNPIRSLRIQSNSESILGSLLVPKIKVSNLRIVFVSLHADFVDLARI